MNAIRVERRGEGIAVVVLDHPERPVNTLSEALVDEFEAVVVPLLEDPEVRGLVLASAKPDTFIAGADLERLDEYERAEEASRMSRRGHAVLDRMESCPKPVVAAVHGAALGGGLEVALACHYILASDDPATVLALPEVMLGLLPGGGGTFRLVQRLGLTTALPMMLTGRRVRARSALRMGLVDALTTPGGIGSSAVRVAERLAEGSLHLPRRRHGFVDRVAALPLARSLVLAQARQQVRRQTRGNYPAPEEILACVAAGLAGGPAAGRVREAEGFGRLVVSPESRSLRWLFLASTGLKKDPSPADPRPVRRLAVLGAGLMGSGIASVSVGEWAVVVRDLDEKTLARAARDVRSGLDKQVRSGSLRRADARRRWSRLLLTRAPSELAGADLVVEAVFENLELKQRVLAEVEELVGPDAVFASNTSALPISDIAAHARHPERVLGMHYFSPVPKMPLLEIVVSDRTAPWAVATARAVGQAQGKTCIVVRDRPGFYTTRILAPYLNEAMLLLEEGARVEELDRALKDWGFPVGPVALVDEVGVDVGAHVGETLGQAFSARGLGASPALPKLVTAGLLGRKSRRGFYLYPSRGRKRPNDAVYPLLGGAARRSLDRQEAQDRLALLMVNEAAHCLAEGVVASPRDADLGAVMGLGFPPFRGGPFHHVDAAGAGVVVGRLGELAGRYGPRFAPAPLLVEAAGSGRRFFPS